MRRRVKVTGVGPVTPAGIGVADFRVGIMAPVSRARLVEQMQNEPRSFIAMEVPEFDPLTFTDATTARRAARHTLLAVAAARLALDHAGLRGQDLTRLDPLVTSGTSLMDFDAMSRVADFVFRHGPEVVLPPVVHTASLSAIAAAVAAVVGGNARTMTWQSACCSGLDAVGHGFEAVARGETDLAVCGGTEAPVSFFPMLCLRAVGLASSNDEWPERQCRPFDLWRTTGAIAEGACMLVLEPEESPRRALAWISGYAHATDVGGDAARGMARAIELALANAGRRVREVDAVSAWGPGHRVVDAAEARALQAVFGARLPEVAVYSIKGAVGNALGAAGAIQAGCAALDLSEGRMPPTVNWVRPDPACPLNLSRAPRALTPEVMLVDAHGLSGTNAALVLERA